ncbi:MAG TPA: GGDEF domain-containing protein [Alphaproteobacteria bacterium]|nr:GGDEF domain-containing protein [Alphaproteobacteria bacterium]
MKILANTTTLPLLAPLGSVIAAWAVLSWFEPVPASASQFLAVAPLILFGIGAALAAYFKLSNAVLQFALLAVSHVVVNHAGALPGAGAARVVGLATLLIPFAFAVLGALEDRGLFTYDGIVRWLALCVTMALAALAAMLAPSAVDGVLGIEFLPVALPLPQPVVVAGISSVAIAMLLFLRRGSPLEAGALAALAALLLAFARGPGSTATLLLCAAGLLLTVAVLQHGYRLAFLDELTRLPGRRALELQLKRLSGPYAVAMVDVDFFKKFNDTYGHDVGDQALRLVARCLRQVGGGGRPYRYGGEEFTVLFPGQTAREAASALEELRELIATTPFRLRGPDRPKSKRARTRRNTGVGARILRLTVSIGVAEQSQANRLPEAVVKAADKALYRAKSRGRNQVAR